MLEDGVRTCALLYERPMVAGTAVSRDELGLLIQTAGAAELFFFLLLPPWLLLVGDCLRGGVLSPGCLSGQFLPAWHTPSF